MKKASQNRFVGGGGQYLLHTISQRIPTYIEVSEYACLSTRFLDVDIMWAAANITFGRVRSPYGNLVGRAAAAIGIPELGELIAASNLQCGLAFLFHVNDTKRMYCWLVGFVVAETTHPIKTVKILNR